MDIKQGRILFSSIESIPADDDDDVKFENKEI